MSLTEKQTTASNWFRTLRDQICAEFEAIEAEYAASEVACVAEGEPRSGGGVGAMSPSETRVFTRTPWSRPEGGSGEIGLMKGRVFEKVGVNISTVHGEFSEQFRREIPGAAENPKFWASGISLVAHPHNPLVPAAHMNTRMIVVGDGARLWFGGGGDLTPTFPIDSDTADFHAAFKAACDTSDSNFYEAFSAWCREYFWLPHRNEERGVGGIFYDYLGLNTLVPNATPVAPGQFGKGGLGKEATAAGMALASNAALDWNQCFAFTQAVGTAFQNIYSALVRRHRFDAYTPEQKHAQLVKRGRYAEYNLLYDRGTRFGLMTGGNPEAILMSLPPEAVWE